MKRYFDRKLREFELGQVELDEAPRVTATMARRVRNYPVCQPKADLGEPRRAEFADGLLARLHREGEK